MWFASCVINKPINQSGSMTDYLIRVRHDRCDPISATKKFPAQQIAIIFQEGEIKIAEIFDVLYFYFQLLR